MYFTFTCYLFIGIGMVLASLSVILAAGTEIWRKNIMRDGGFVEQELAGEIFNASTLTVFAQIPQLTIIGASEVFTSITGEYRVMGRGGVEGEE